MITKIYIYEIFHKIKIINIMKTFLIFIIFINKKKNVNIKYVD